MKKRFLIIVTSIAAIALIACTAPNQNNGNEPWTKKQLMEPADLAKILNDANSKKPIILNIGFVGNIKGAISMGAAVQKGGLDNLKKELSSLPKDADIVIYCGCCPFKDCPNIRPAFKLLNDMQFTNGKLLNLSQNLKVDWIDKGYPME